MLAHPHSNAVALMNEERSIPRHIAIIMDGNGRWAKERGLPRREGHRAGAESVRECVEACKELGVEYLTLYAFSSENWNRPAAEVSALMALLERFLEEKAEELMKQNVRLTAIGHLDRLPERTWRKLDKAMQRTAGNTSLTDPDLLVRTSGEFRVSNFLLWQISYAEIILFKKFWPDFRQSDLFEAVQEYARRHRRFGGL